MLWLAAHMWILLLAAFAIGLSIGWWIWGGRAPLAAELGDDEPMGTLDSDLEVAPDDDGELAAENSEDEARGLRAMR